MRTALTVLVTLLILAAPAAERQPDALVRIGQVEFKVEAACTAEQRAHGLMGRQELCAECGMLFVFHSADVLSFWMKDTPLPLSIAFISKDGTIIDIQDMEPFSLDSHDSAGPALMALEVNRGEFARRGVRVNDRISIVFTDGAVWPR